MRLSTIGTWLLIALVSIGAAGAVRAHDGHDHGIGPAEIIATLKKAHDDFHGAGGAAAAKATLIALSTKLAADPTPYNKWVQVRVNDIVLSINGNDLPAAEKRLHELIEVLTRPPGSLTRPVLKTKCNELHDILHGQTPDAAQRCAAATKAYSESLRPDTSPLSQWAQRRFNDIVASFAANQVAVAERKLHDMIAALNS